jgi:hypothetical protein
LASSHSTPIGELDEIERELTAPELAPGFDQGALLLHIGLLFAAVFLALVPAHPCGITTNPKRKRPMIRPTAPSPVGVHAKSRRVFVRAVSGQYHIASSSGIRAALDP